MWRKYIMPNVTITVPEEMKAEMDKYSEVSWSEICRNAISQYIAQREAPSPRIDLDVRQPRMTHYDYETGYATLIIDLRIQNRMNSEITVDRILATTTAETHDDGRIVSFGQACELHRKTIGSNAVGLATIRFTFPREKLEEFQSKFTRTFDCRVYCAVYVDGFKDSYKQEFSVQIAIDVWNNVIKKALERSQATQ